MGRIRTILLGAGAETPLHIGSGADFTLNTFYRRNRALYDALADFYHHGFNESCVMIPRYQRQFLLSRKSSLFIKMLTLVLNNHHLTQCLLLDAGIPVSESKLNDARRQLNSPGGLEKDFFTADELTELMSLIVDCEKSLNEIAAVHGIDNAHYGLLESYYSSLISPNQNEARVWKLINFYWTAFFYISRPILGDEWGPEEAEWTKENYLSVLNDLPAAVSSIYTNINNVINRADKPYHQQCVIDAFDHVITTNYTPYSEYFFSAQSGDTSGGNIAWLSGKLSQFERIDTLSTFDIRTEPEYAASRSFFPFLMCQAPVKPIVNTSQIREYGKALDFLNSSDELAVLGYAFCEEDTHIITMVSEALNRNPKMKLIYFKYCVEKGEPHPSEVANDLFKKLRLSIAHQRNQIEVVLLPKGNPDPFLQYARKHHNADS